jgi:hypothetical protein
MRAAAGLALLLTACAPGAAGQPSGGTIDCAVESAAAFTRDCTVERSEQNGRRFLVVRHPDGGFRRFEVIDGGNSLAAADGAEALAIARSGDRLDVSIDGDRYRFPSSVLNDDGKR